MRARQKHALAMLGREDDGRSAAVFCQCKRLADAVVEVADRIARLARVHSARPLQRLFA
ncbi:hypothetical protein D3C78_1903970 [compost metagenome]